MDRLIRNSRMEKIYIFGTSDDLCNGFRGGREDGVSVKAIEVDVSRDIKARHLLFLLLLGDGEEERELKKRWKDW